MISTPRNANWVHLGGQLNTTPCCFNNLSLGVGTGYTHRFKSHGTGSRILEELGFTVHYLRNKDDPTDRPDVEESGIATRVFAKVWGTDVHFLYWDGGSDNFNSSKGDIITPGVALAKGDPIYKAEDFQEIGFARSWMLSDEVSLDVDFRGQFIQDEVGAVFAFNFTWKPQFSLFEDYFAKKRNSARKR